MAKINKEILGKVRGSLGDITFRQLNGKTYISTKPVSFVPGTDANSIARREKFSLAVKIAKSINSVSILKDVWAKDTPQNVSVFNHIMRSNYPMINSNGSIGLIKLFPYFGFAVNNPVVLFNPTEIKVNIDAIGTSSGIDTSIETTLNLVSLVYLSNPSEDSMIKSSFTTAVSVPIATDLEAAQEFTISLNDVESQMLSIYQSRKGFFALVTYDSAGNIVHYSNTFIA
ncbi:MAG: hypothetical protein STSR0008_24590 [Ignavibacterium sp.]